MPPEFSLLGGGILTNGFLFFVIKRKESPAQRARANRFFCVFYKEVVAFALSVRYRNGIGALS